MRKKRVVVTGLGTVNPCGLNAEDSWQAVLSGQSGIRTIQSFDTSEFSVAIGGEVHGFDPTSVLSIKDTRKLDPFIQYALVAAEEGIAQAGFSSDLKPERVGVAVGSGIGGLSTIESNVLQLANNGPRRVSPSLVPGSVINMASGNIAIRHGYRGPNFSISTACTSGSHNIGYAARTIVYGDADVMIAGGSEMACSPIGLAGFASARALSTRNDAPEEASRPWDKDRDGFVLSNGAGILVLESLDHAVQRGATILAEISGFGMSDDAFHVTSPPDDGAGAALAMNNALRDAGLTSSDIHYVNAHGTSTQAGDVAEIQAIRTVFGQDASRIPVSSTKSMTGHLVGAAGALEALFCVLALRDQIAPGTRNLAESDVGDDIDLMPNSSRVLPLAHVMSNSFGFGGTNSSLIFSRWEGA